MAVPEKCDWRSILHCAAAVLGVAMLLAPAALAQRGMQRKPKTPRALALVEWPAKGAPRLVPICILIDGRFYDAGIYKADPVPMALDSGNVYEVEHSGEPEGFFTVNQAAQQGDNWFGVGAYSTLQAVQAAAQHGPSQVKVGGGSAQQEGPPKLRRPGKKEPEAPPSSSPSPTENKPPASAPSGEDGPPVLRRPAPGPESTPPSPEAKPATAAVAAPPAAPEATEEADPNRPRLRRGKPAAQIALETMEAPAAAVPASAVPGAKAGGAMQNPAAPTKVLAAISDAKGPQPRSFLFDWTPQEQTQITAGMQDLARASLQEYLKGRDQAAGPLQDVQVKAFDLDLSNDAVFVLTATAGPAPPAPIQRSARGRKAEPPAPPPENKPVTYFVTVVARQNLEGKLRRVFRRVTDSGHLDAYSRLELIDAVDADGEGRGELLFRAINDQSRAFILYRAGLDNLTEVFNSGELER